MKYSVIYTLLQIKLREEKRHRMTDLGERNLTIRRGKLVKIHGDPERKDGASAGHHRVWGPPVGEEA